MRKNPLSVLAFAAILTGIGCEKHTAAPTLTGFTEQQAREAETPLVINPDAPRFFPPQKSQQ